MKISSKSLEFLLKAIEGEARSSCQYEADAVMYENLGVPALAAHSRKEAEEERGHMRVFMDRLTLGGGSIIISGIGFTGMSTVDGIISSVRSLEMEAVTLYRKAVSELMTEDPGTSQIFVNTLLVEEEHAHWAETQLEQISRIGIAAFTTAWTAKEAD